MKTLLLTRPHPVRRVLTAPLLWHTRFSAWLEENDPRPFFRHADFALELAAIGGTVALFAVVVGGYVHHLLTAH